MKYLKTRKIIWMMCLLSLVAFGMTAEAAPGQFVWLGPSDSGGWSSFMQIVMQPEYRMQMSNGTPFWNAMLIPISAGSASTGMPSIGAPAFGFCPAPGECYAVMVQRPFSTNSPSGAPVCPPTGVTPPSGANPGNKPTSLW